MKYTIIITTYNNEKYISKCLDSIINQTLKNFNVIIIDDGSTDSTKEIIKSYLKNEYIKYYYKKNTGVADSRNFGIKKVKTPYFLFVDSDDYIKNDLIEKINKYENYDLLSFKALKVSPKGNIIQKLEKTDFHFTNGKEYLYSLMKNRKLYFFLTPWGYVYNTEFWNKNKFKYSKNYVMEDAGLTPLVILASEKIKTLNYYGYYYVQTDESIIRTNNEDKIELNTKSVLFQYDCLTEYINLKELDNDFKNVFFEYFIGWLFWYGTTLKDSKLKQYIKELKKRKVLSKLRLKNFTIACKVLICKINYIAYFKIYKFAAKLTR